MPKPSNGTGGKEGREGGRHGQRRVCRRRIRARLVSVNDKLPKMALGIHPGNYHYPGLKLVRWPG